MNERFSNEDAVEHRQRAAQQIGQDAIGKELFDETHDVFQIAVYVNGRMIHTKTDTATVARIMALLTGTAD
jgi:hypothetical protein